MDELNWATLTAPFRQAVDLIRAAHRLTRRLGEDDSFRERLETFDALPACLTFSPFEAVRQPRREGGSNRPPPPPSPASQPGPPLPGSHDRPGSRGGASPSPHPPTGPSAPGSIPGSNRPSTATAPETEPALAQIARLVALLEAASKPVDPSPRQLLSLPAARRSPSPAAPADTAHQAAAMIPRVSPANAAGSSGRSATMLPSATSDWVASAALLGELLPSPGSGSNPTTASPKMFNPAQRPVDPAGPATTPPRAGPARLARSNLPPAAALESTPGGREESVLDETAASTRLADLVDALWSSRNLEHPERARTARSASGSSDQGHLPRPRASSRLWPVDEPQPRQADRPDSQAGDEQRLNGVVPPDTKTESDRSLADRINRELIEEAGLRGVDLT